jgi:hypothetical protein
MTVATALAIQIVHFAPESIRSDQWFGAVTRAAREAGVEISATPHHVASASTIMLWGPGAPARRDVIGAHVAAGGHVIALDLSYWNRDKKARISIDAPHPQAWVMRTALPSDRFERDPVYVGDHWKPNGPIVIAGIGPKARAQYGPVVATWEQGMATACRDRWPDRRVLYRRKKRYDEIPSWADPALDGAIDDVLKGASLVVTWHSNVAVDAIRLGIPVVCRDGAAAALCPSDLPDDPRPLDPALRERFLANLAWFQWSLAEAPAMLAFLRELLA